VFGVECTFRVNSWLGCEEGVKQTDNEEHIENLQKNDTGVLEEGSGEISEEE
jgi:hypothetical protein